MDIAVLSVMTFLIGFIVSQNMREEKTSSIVSDDAYYRFKIQLDEDRMKNRQELEDMNFESAIRRNASRQFQNYLDWLTWEQETEGQDMWQKHMHPMAPRIQIFNPLDFAYIIYHESAKYAKIDPKKLIVEEFDRMKLDHEIKLSKLKPEIKLLG